MDRAEKKLCSFAIADASGLKRRNIEEHRKKQCGKGRERGRVQYTPHLYFFPSITVQSDELFSFYYFFPAVYILPVLPP